MVINVLNPSKVTGENLTWKRLLNDTFLHILQVFYSKDTNAIEHHEVLHVYIMQL